MLARTAEFAVVSGYLLVAQRLFDRADGGLGVRLFPRLKPGDHLSLAVDEELVEVPLDLTGEFRIGRLARQEVKERIDPLDPSRRSSRREGS